MLIAESLPDQIGQSAELLIKIKGKNPSIERLASSMVSKHFCPKCESFNLKRIHRGYFAKHVLKQSPLYQCAGCGEKTSEADLSKNETKKVPAFIEDDYPTSMPPF